MLPVCSSRFPVIPPVVSGGDIGARDAKLSIMVGGEKSTYEKVLPLFKVRSTPPSSPLVHGNQHPLHGSRWLWSAHQDGQPDPHRHQHGTSPASPFTSRSVSSRASSTATRPVSISKRPLPPSVRSPPPPPLSRCRCCWLLEHQQPRTPYGQEKLRSRFLCGSRTCLRLHLTP